MASQVEIVNAGLTILGSGRITSIDDDLKAAREAKAIYDITRNALLASHNWSFAKARAQLPALSTAPLFEYAYQYQIPVDCMRLLFVGDWYAGLDLTDYRGSPTEEFVIEGRVILTNFTSPLNVKYVKLISDTTQFAPAFTLMFAAALAEVLAEPLTQSDSKKEFAARAKQRALNDAIRANAIEMPPTKLPDDEWLISRL